MDKLIFGIAYYQKKDWEKFLKTADDRVDMEDTWEEWKDNYDKQTAIFKKKKIVFEPVELDIKKMVKYVKKRKIKNNSSNRSSYVAELLQNKYEGKNNLEKI